MYIMEYENTISPNDGKEAEQRIDRQLPWSIGANEPPTSGHQTC